MKGGIELGSFLVGDLGDGEHSEVLHCMRSTLWSVGHGASGAWRW